MSYRSSPGNHSPALHNFDGLGLCLPFQDGPVQEFGRNGTTNEEVIEALIERLQSLNAMFDGKYACEENTWAISHLHSALSALNERTRRRTLRGVEGTSTV